jgi:hypothetical protein
MLQSLEKTAKTKPPTTAPGIIQTDRCIYDNPKNTARAIRKDTAAQQPADTDRPAAKTLIRNDASAQIPAAMIAFPVLFQTPNTAIRKSTLKGSSNIYKIHIKLFILLLHHIIVNFFLMCLP